MLSPRRGNMTHQLCTVFSKLCVTDSSIKFMFRTVPDLKIRSNILQCQASLPQDKPVRSFSRPFRNVVPVISWRYSMPIISPGNRHTCSGLINMAIAFDLSADICNQHTNFFGKDLSLFFKIHKCHQLFSEYICCRLFFLTFHPFFYTCSIINTGSWFIFQGSIVYRNKQRSAFPAFCKIQWSSVTKRIIGERVIYVSSPRIFSSLVLQAL